MKAIAINSFGGPEVIRLMDLPQPEPADSEILIRVKAAGVNPVDWKIRAGLLEGRLPHQFPIILGWDAAGVVEAVGSEVRDYHEGDAVMTYARKPVIHGGTYAEYVVVPPNNVAMKPSHLPFEEAAVLPLAGLTAYQTLFDALHLAKDETILIQAGGGGVGGYAVQLAKGAGATVIATASADKVDYVKKLGADWVINYRQDNFMDAVRKRYPDGIDAVFDTVGGKVQQESLRVLRSGGRLASILAIDNVDQIKADGLIPHYVFVSPHGKQLATLGEMVGQGRLRIPLTKVLSLEEATKALALVEAGHMHGKIALTIG